MNHVPSILLITAVLACHGTASRAQTVPGNEAVRTTGTGKSVDLPPVPASVSKPCAATAACHAGAWHMVETSDGLRECTEPYARPTTCRVSSYGTQKLPRLWIVKTQARWRWCQYPDLGSKCVDIFAKPPANLPYDAIQ
ncbi:MAG: hypothetical protein K8R60_06870 [Burkholderiales bacterium]|nr:hypothetical protein [Burkholderiales bacterium]